MSQQEEEITLHPEDTKQRQDTYSSLTALNGVDVFSTEFQGCVKQILDVKNKRQDEIKEEVFAVQVISQQDFEMQATTQLFSGQKDMVLAHDYSASVGKWSLLNTGMVLIAVMAVSALYLFFFQDRKVRR